MRDIKEIDEIIVHCSASPFGDAGLIDAWHKKRGWDCIGYHYVVLNGFRKKGIHRPEDDGLIELGRPVGIQGAHVRGHNRNSIGVCLIGERTFTARQLLVALPKLIEELRGAYEIFPAVLRVTGHYELDPHKTCPNMDMDLIRKHLGINA